MSRRTPGTAWARALGRSLAAFQRKTVRSGTRALARALKSPAAKRKPRPAASAARAGGFLPNGLAVGASGALRFRLYRPPDTRAGERLPLLVMLHGCGQTASSFALSTRMNSLAARQRFFVLYPEQDRLANPQGCWNWFATRSGRADGEVALIMSAIEQVCLLQPVDRARVAVVGLSAGASLAALLATRHPESFKAVVMHSGVPPGAAHSALSAMRAMRGRGVAKPVRGKPAAPGRLAPVAAVPWPPLLVIHGSKDAVVSPGNGLDAAEQWADASGARAVPARNVQRGHRYPMTVTDYKCSGRTLVTRVDVAGLGHAWSGGAASQAFSDSAGPDASRLSWSFVARHLKA